MASYKLNPLSGNFDLVLDKASEIKYDNSSSGLTAQELQSAVDELDLIIKTLPDPIYYAGTWDASTNTPTLSNADIDKTGALYQVNVAGTVNFGAGPIAFDIGDKVVNNGTIWEKWDYTDAVNSVNGKTGFVTLNTDDVSEGTLNLYYTTTRFDSRLATKTTSDLTEGVNLYFTDERAQDAVGGILVNSATISLTYDDAGNAIYGEVNDNSITDIKIVPGIDAEKIADGSVSNIEFQYLDGVTSNIQTQLDGKTGLVPGDIPKTTFSSTTSASPANVTGASFSNAVVRSFNMTMDVVGTDYATINIKGIQRGSDWSITQQVTGDDVGIVFSITNSGQIQYISNANYNLSFKADVVGI